MEEEIDIRQYVAVLFDYWKWVVGIPIVAMVVTFAVTSLETPIYEAKALVTTSAPRMEVQFTPDIRTEYNLPNQLSVDNVFPTIATSDVVLTQLLQLLNEEDIILREGEVNRVEMLRGDSLEATSIGQGLIELAVQSPDAAQAAFIVNQWADIFATYADTLYGQRDEDTQMFTLELANTNETLQQLEAQLTEIGTQTGQGLLQTGGTYAQAGILGAQLQAKVNLLIDNQDKLNRLELLIAQAQDLQQAVAEDDIDETTAAMGLMVELAQLNARQTDSPVNINFDIQLTDDSQLRVRDVLATLQSNLNATKATITQLSEEVNQMQADMAVQHYQYNALSREYTLQEQVFLSLSRKVNETAIGDEAGALVEVASFATTPEDPLPSRRLVTTAVAGVLGGMVTIFAVFALEWWREGQEGIPQQGRIGVEKS